MPVKAYLAIAFLAVVGACGGRTSAPGDGDSGTGGGASGSGGAGSGSGSQTPACAQGSATPACWSCMTKACPELVSCDTGPCAGYLQCACGCAQADGNCLQSCNVSLTTACEVCLMRDTLCDRRPCDSACGVTSPSGGDGGTPGICTPKTADCTNGSPPGTYEACTVPGDGGCVSAYMQLANGQTFPCASCTDLAGCIQGATTAACY